MHRTILLALCLLFVLSPVVSQSQEDNIIGTMRVNMTNTPNDTKSISKLWESVRFSTSYQTHYNISTTLSQVDLALISTKALAQFYLPMMQQEVTWWMYNDSVYSNIRDYHTTPFVNNLSASSKSPREEIEQTVYRAQQALRSLGEGYNMRDMAASDKQFEFMPLYWYGVAERMLYLSPDYMVDHHYLDIPDSVAVALEQTLHITDIRHHVQQGLDAFFETAQDENNAPLLYRKAYECIYFFLYFASDAERKFFGTTFQSIFAQQSSHPDLARSEYITLCADIMTERCPALASFFASQADIITASSDHSIESVEQLANMTMDLQNQGYDFTTIHPSRYDGSWKDSEVFNQYREFYTMVEYKLILILSTEAYTLQDLTLPAYRDVYSFFSKSTQETSMYSVVTEFTYLAADNLMWLYDQQPASWVLDAIERLTLLMRIINTPNLCNYWSVYQLSALTSYIPFIETKKQIIEQSLLPLYRTVNWKELSQDYKELFLFAYVWSLAELTFLECTDYAAIEDELVFIHQLSLKCNAYVKYSVNSLIAEIMNYSGFAEEAIDYYQQILKELPHTDEMQDIQTDCLKDMMFAYYGLQQYENAYACYQALPDTSNIASSDHRMIASIGAYLNDSALVQSHLQTYYRLVEKDLYNILFNTSGQQMVELEDQIKDVVPLYELLSDSLSLSCSQWVAQFVYDFQLMVKGITLSVSQQVDDLLLNHPSEIIRRQYRHYRDLGEQPTSSLNEMQLAVLELDKQRTHKFLMTQIRSWNDEHPHAKAFTMWQEVRDHLKENEIAVEFVRYESPSDTMYSALVLQHQWQSPKWIPLCSDSLLRRYTKVEQSPLYQLLWQPILEAAAITKGGSIYFSADGLLYQLPIEYAFCANDVTMSDAYCMTRVSSTREVANRASATARDGIALFGGLEYSLDSTAMAQPPVATTRSLNRDLTIEDCFGDSLRAANRRISYLPGTLLEINTIKRFFSDTLLLTGSEGREESFKALSGQAPPFIHIGTHGYYLRPTQQELQSGGVIDYSMSRTGLLMAGAQAAWSGEPIPQGIEDGLLTAKEIAQLDLHNVQMAVLSACETGSGAITNDGVSGLQRGFKKAGVHTIVMSLWPVDDNATRLLMTEFYRNWIEKHQTKREAFTNARNAVRYAVDEDGDFMYANPVYWAGFIMMD